MSRVLLWVFYTSPVFFVSTYRKQQRFWSVFCCFFFFVLFCSQTKCSSEEKSLRKWAQFSGWNEWRAIYLLYFSEGKKTGSISEMKDRLHFNCYWHDNNAENVPWKCRTISSQATVANLPWHFGGKSCDGLVALETNMHMFDFLTPCGMSLKQHRNVRNPTSFFFEK